MQNVEKTRIIMEGLGQGTKLILWYSVQEKLLLHQSSETESQLQLGLLGLY